jgi:hypothetical protein
MIKDVPAAMNPESPNRWRITERFDAFLFASCDPCVASLLRIGMGILLVIYVTVWMMDGSFWFSDAGVLSRQAAELLGEGDRTSLLNYLPQTPIAVHTCLAILLGQTLLLLLGCWSRLQMVCIFVWLVSFQHRNLMIVDGEDAVFRLLAFFMIFLPLDYRWSLARTVFKIPSHEGPQHAWGIRLIQIQMCVIYLSSVWCKLQGETWRAGTALFYVSRLDDYFGRTSLPEPLLDTPWLVHALTWSVLAIELVVPFSLWIPRLRVPSLIVATLLHVGIELMMNLFLFQWLMLVSLLSFVRCRPIAPPRLPHDAH